MRNGEPTFDGEFKNPDAPTLEKFEQILSEGDPKALIEALIGIALGNDDFVSAFRAVTTPKVTDHADPGVRGAAVLSLGHLARIHRTLPDEPTCSLIVRAAQDDDALVRGQAANAWSDIEVYAPQLARRLKSRLPGGEK
jgi:hypothetical protein